MLTAMSGSNVTSALLKLYLGAKELSKLLKTVLIGEALEPLN